MSLNCEDVEIRDPPFLEFWKRVLSNAPSKRSRDSICRNSVVLKMHKINDTSRFQLRADSPIRPIVKVSASLPSSA